MTRSRLLPPLAGAALRLASAGALSLGALCAAPLPAHAAPQAPGGEGARAHDLFTKGREEYAKGHLPEAYAQFIEAWTLQKSPDVAANLALVENKLARWREAAAHATYALANLPDGASDAQRRIVQEALEAAKKHVGTITLRVSIEHAAVTVDHEPLGESPLTAEIFLDPGTHTLSAAAPGCEPARDTVAAKAGSTHLITLTLGKCAGGNRDGNRDGKPPLVEEPKGLRPITIGGIATTGVGLGLGAAFAIMSAVKGNDASSAASNLGSSPTACAGANATSSGCKSLHDALSAHDTFASAAVWTFVGAAAVGAGTLIYTFVVPRPPAAPKSAGVQVIPVAGPGGGGVMLKGAF